MDKSIIKEALVSLEGAALQSACEKYVADARLDRSGPIESDEQAQSEIARDLSEALDKRRYEIGEGKASFSFVCGCFHAAPLFGISSRVLRSGTGSLCFARFAVSQIL